MLVEELRDRVAPARHRGGPDHRDVVLAEGQVRIPAVDVGRRRQDTVTAGPARELQDILGAPGVDPQRVESPPVTRDLEGSEMHDAVDIVRHRLQRRRIGDVGVQKPEGRTVPMGRDVAQGAHRQVLLGDQNSHLLLFLVVVGPLGQQPAGHVTRCQAAGDGNDHQNHGLGLHGCFPPGVGASLGPHALFRQAESLDFNFCACSERVGCMDRSGSYRCT